MNQHFRTAIEAIPALFHALASSAPLAERRSAAHKKKPGVYVFLENGIPVHVGRTRDLRRRMGDHVAKSHFAASFAFKRARRALDKPASYTTKDSRGELAKDPVFMPEFHRQIDLVKGMEVRFLEVRDPVAQYLLELYAHMEYGLPLDEFDTH